MNDKQRIEAQAHVGNALLYLAAGDTGKARKYMRLAKRTLKANNERIPQGS